MVKGDFMKVNIFKTAEEIGAAVARIFVDEVKNKFVTNIIKHLFNPIIRIK